MQAVSLWSRVLSEHATEATPGVYSSLARAWRRIGKLTRAQEVIDRGEARFGATASADIQLEHAILASASQDWPKALEIWSSLIPRARQKAGSLVVKQIAEAVDHLAQEGPLGRDQIAVAVEAIGRDLHEPTASRVRGALALKGGAFDLSRKYWNAYWKRAIAGDREADIGASLRSFENHSVERFELNARRPSSIEAKAERIAVYTALFGDYDELQPPLFRPAGVDFICFSDRDRNVPGWKVEVVDDGETDFILKNRYYKLLPHRHLSEYAASLYIDANLLVVGDIALLFRQWVAGRPFVAWAHPNRSDVFDEIEAILTNLRSDPDPILDQAKMFAAEGLPRHVGLVEAAFLWRDHTDPGVIELMEAWWKHVKTYGRRDQPGLGFLMWKTQVRPRIMPPRLGDTRTNDFTIKMKHKRTPLDLALDRIKADRSASAGTGEQAARPGTGRAPSGRERKLVWVCRENLRQVASTVMRGEQLSSMMRGRIAGAEIDYVNETALEGLSDSIVVLTKSFLKRATPQELEALKTRGNVVCVDYVDDKSRRELDEFIDVYLASSIRQYLAYKNEHSEKLVHMITHHPDPEIRDITGPKDYCNIGYYGELANARYREEMQGLIDFCLVHTKVVDPANRNWIQRLRHSNVHYAVRERREFDGFKPFLKGFTAAACQANIIVPATEGDARFYLTSDYPYMLPDQSIESVREMVRYCFESFGGAEWKRALEIMASVRERCSADHIRGEVQDLVDTIENA